ncbi:MAG: hypothetical protein K2W96_08680 [Gemmataceae bacterium]|nr:hypothetical protein [Gemmataceae bacterium]
MLRRFMAGLLVLGFLAGIAVPVLGQDKEKDKAKDKGKEEPKDKDKGTGKEEPKGAALKWKFEKGVPFYQKLTTTTSQNMQVMNNDVTQTQSQVFFFSWTPEKTDGDKVTLKQKIEGVIMDIDIGGNKIAYDSTKEQQANNPLADYFKALKGSEFTLVLDTKKMQVEKVEGRDDFLRKLIAANPQMKQLLDAILSESALKEMAEPTFAVVPAKADEKKWERRTSLDMGPIGKYDNTYSFEYVKATGDKHEIKVDTNLAYTAPGEDKRAGLPFTIKSATLKSGKGKGDNIIIFDAAKGRLEKSTMEVKLTGELSIDIGGSTTKVTLNQTQTSVIEALDKLPDAIKPKS